MSNRLWSKKYVTDQQIIEIVSLGYPMNTCAAKLGLKSSTFKRRALLLGVYEPNQGRRGIKRDPKEFEKMRIPTEKIISGEHDREYSSARLRKRLVSEGHKENNCEKCGINEWMGQKITLELHHIDGNRINNRLENLVILCPNCHSLTPNHSKQK
jgi:hypothetical protein